MSITRTWYCAVALLAAASAAGGCGGSSSLQHDAAAQQDANQQQDTGPVCSVAVTTTLPACDGCLADKCCDAAATCLADAACKPWLECVSACQPTDETCILGCWSNTPPGDLGTVYVNCLVRDCATECQAQACGGWIWNDDTCGQCNNTNCCAENTACGTDLECARFVDCINACAPTDAACSTACYKDHRDGAYTKAPAMACLFSNCATECGAPSPACKGWNFTVAACGTCTTTNCCDEWSAPLLSPDGWAYYTCTWGCGTDQACLNDCYHTQWRGAGLANVAAFCQQTSCASECNVTTPPTCGFLGSADATCDTCIKAHCCDADIACSENADCMAYVACASGCAQGDDACNQACIDSASELGFATFFAYNVVCAGESCNTECGFSQPITCGGLGFQDATCNTCLQDHCCDAATALTTDTQALALEICVERCTVGDTGCEDTCKAGYANDQQTKVQAFRGCIDTNCGTDCWTPPQADGGSGT